jgi:sarcosine oxidase delta subunit
MPTFECTVCGHKTRAEFEVSCTGDAKLNVEKAPWCCGKEMIEAIDD